MKTTLMVSFVMLFAMAGALWLLCYVSNKDLQARIDLPCITKAQREVGEKEKYADSLSNNEAAKGPSGLTIVEDYKDNESNRDPEE